jgi:hypothetical protein
MITATHYICDVPVPTSDETPFSSIENELRDHTCGMQSEELSSFVCDMFYKWLNVRDELDKVVEERYTEIYADGDGLTAHVAADRDTFMYKFTGDSRLEQFHTKLTFSEEEPSLSVTSHFGDGSHLAAFHTEKYRCIEDVIGQIFNSHIEYMEGMLAEGNIYDRPDWDTTVKDFSYCIDQERKHMVYIADRFYSWLKNNRPFESVTVMGGHNPFILSATRSVFKMQLCFTHHIYEKSPDAIQNKMLLLVVRVDECSNGGDERKRERGEEYDQLVDKRVRVDDD